MARYSFHFSNGPKMDLIIFGLYNIQMPMYSFHMSENIFLNFSDIILSFS